MSRPGPAILTLLAGTLLLLAVLAVPRRRPRYALAALLAAAPARMGSWCLIHR